MKKTLLIVVFLALVLGLVACSRQEDKSKSDKKTKAKEELILATTTSVQDSGLLGTLVPVFEKESGYKVKVVAVGTGQALQMGKDGEADVLLVHAPADEKTFMDEGHGVKRESLMENKFVLIGPNADPAKMSGDNVKTVSEALKAVANSKGEFVSRGDASGTHKKELKLWDAAKIDPKKALRDRYIEAGKGLGDVVMMANEKQGYTLSDKATFLSMKDKIEMKITFVGDDPSLVNTYSVITIDPKKNDQINKEGADAFYEWMGKSVAAKLVKEYGIDPYGEPLFFLVNK